MMGVCSISDDVPAGARGRGRRGGAAEGLHPAHLLARVQGSERRACLTQLLGLGGEQGERHRLWSDIGV